jgi:hypothetical protein
VKAEDICKALRSTPHRAQGPGVPAATPPSPPPVKNPRKKARQVCWLFCAVFLPPVARGRGRRPYPGIAAPCLGRNHCLFLESIVVSYNIAPSQQTTGRPLLCADFSLCSAARGPRSARSVPWARVLEPCVPGSGLWGAALRWHQGALRFGLLHPCPEQKWIGISAGAQSAAYHYLARALPKIQQPAAKTGEPRPQKTANRNPLTTSKLNAIICVLPC